MNNYQQAATKTSLLGDNPNELYYYALGLAGESGEIANKLKKIIRDHEGDESQIDVADISKELGDVLWYIANLTNYLDIPLDDVAHQNIAKLESRQKRNQLGGSGDNR